MALGIQVQSFEREAYRVIEDLTFDQSGETLPTQQPVHGGHEQTVDANGLAVAVTNRMA